ncbi:hypothetical protein, partial [Microcoleus anatoxicus]
ENHHRVMVEENPYLVALFHHLLGFLGAVQTLNQVILLIPIAVILAIVTALGSVICSVIALTPNLVIILIPITVILAIVTILGSVVCLGIALTPNQVIVMTLAQAIDPIMEMGIMEMGIMEMVAALRTCSRVALTPNQVIFPIQEVVIREAADLIAALAVVIVGGKPCFL